MTVSLSPIQIRSNAKGIVSLIWERNKTGDGSVKSWKLYWSPRLAGPYTAVQTAPIANAVGYGSRYVQHDIIREDLGILSNANFYVRLTSVSAAGVETPQDVTKTRVVYEDGMDLTTRFMYYETDYQAAATDLDFISPDVFDGAIDKIIITRSNASAMKVQVSLVPIGSIANATVGNAGYIDPKTEILIDVESGITLETYYLRLDQTVPDMGLRQVRIKTTGVAGGSMHMLLGRRRLYSYTSADI